MANCNISVARVFNGSKLNSVEISNSVAEERGYAYFLFDDKVYCTRNPIMFDVNLDFTGFYFSDLVS